MQALEALADAIMQFEGWSVGSRSWRNRNPGNLRPFNDSQQHDGQNYRVFTSLSDGWDALRQDLSTKYSKTLGSTATILDLLNKYAPAGDHNNPTRYTSFVCQQLSLHLARSIHSDTTLGELVNGSINDPLARVASSSRFDTTKTASDTASESDEGATKA